MLDTSKIQSKEEQDKEIIRFITENNADPSIKKKAATKFNRSLRRIQYLCKGHPECNNVPKHKTYDSFSETISLYTRGKTPPQISKELNIPVDTIRYRIKKYRNGSHDPLEANDVTGIHPTLMLGLGF